jgi:hypothetical protein
VAVRPGSARGRGASLRPLPAPGTLAPTNPAPHRPTHPPGQVDPHTPDVSRAAHREYMIERCKWAAAALFAQPGAPPPADASVAAKQLRTWSMAGLERLFADLFQVRGGGAGWGVQRVGL